MKPLLKETTMLAGTHWIARAHAIAAFAGGAAFGAVSLIGLFGDESPFWSTLASLACLALGALALGAPKPPVVITREGVVRYGFARWQNRKRTVFFHSMHAVEVRQGWLGRWLDFGDLIVDAGEEQLIWRNIACVSRVANEIMSRVAPS